jgi:hypothetical protein
MASTSSREAALERRKALTNGGKKAAGRYTSAPTRTRSASDARPTRTVVAPEAPVSAASAPVVAERVQSRPASVVPAPGASRRPAGKPVANPSRDLVLARREALSKRGKRADNSKDRTRTDAHQDRSKAASAPAPEQKCKCQDHPAQESRPAARPTLSLTTSSAPARTSPARSTTPKRASQHNPSRALVLSRREALSKRGKAAAGSSNRGTAAVVRLGNPDLTTRELGQKLRDLKNKSGSAGTSRSGGVRPSGPNRQGARIAAAVQASLKVGVSETLSGQVVTGTQANRSPKTTGNEAATCRTITGTEYLGAEVFQAFCQSQPSATQPAKVRVSATSHGNRVTGNEVGRSEKVTGDEPGTCKVITGTEYISANQSAALCGGVSPSPRKVGHSQTQGGRAVSGVMVGRSSKVTGDEAGSGLQLTGDQYLGNEAPVPGTPAPKVSQLNTLRGTGITGTHVGRSDKVTGDEPGTCRRVTGDEYIGSQQFQAFCGSSPEAEAPKVGFSITNRNQVVSGTRTGRSEKVTGDEPGTCKVVTGTPYAGLEQAGDFCRSKQVQAIRQRTPQRGANRMSGIQPGIGGPMTGAERGACADLTGTPYVGRDQQLEACGASSAPDADLPQLLESAPWKAFSVQSPAQVAQVERASSGAVTGSTYEFGGRITGPFAMASNKVTGTEQFRFDRRPAVIPSPATGEDGQPISRVTGEGSGLRITGDDWDRGDRVTGTEGSSARRRNPTRVGPVSAMTAPQRKRNQDLPVPSNKVTGSSGSTDHGSLITVSGGARG